MKRSRGEGEIENISMANCLMLLASGGGGRVGIESESVANSAGRRFECKTCNRQFPSFQALGGHRASHKKPRMMELGMEGEDSHQQLRLQNTPTKPKTHECSICGLEFAVGQALGGHMRRHRTALAGGGGRGGGGGSLSPPPTAPRPQPTTTKTTTTTTTQVAVLKKSQSRRVLCLDLNLTPYENGIGLEFPLGKISSTVPSVIA
ncbi:zinc finger protein ZAT12-like [Macadamia integrifolia]|uniref:zinc finger protein ZAT12-like n=1 Tax=Macadamia integrifolia TaxID=60698 RepID=UPI001C4F5C57|nr:zinc finger protein ZAT12-like [Macadamia integrifolia]